MVGFARLTGLLLVCMQIGELNQELPSSFDCVRYDRACCVWRSLARSTVFPLSDRSCFHAVDFADYLAPEIFSPNASLHGYDETVDIWTLGVLAYELVVGRPPFEPCFGDTSDSTSGSSSSCSNGSTFTKDSGLLASFERSVESENEATFRRINSLHFKFPAHVSPGARDLIKKLLRREPELRLTLEEVLEHRWVA